MTLISKKGALLELILSFEKKITKFYINILGEKGGSDKISSKF